MTSTPKALTADQRKLVQEHVGLMAPVTWMEGMLLDWLRDYEATVCELEQRVCTCDVEVVTPPAEKEGWARERYPELPGGEGSLDHHKRHYYKGGKSVCGLSHYPIWGDLGKYFLCRKCSRLFGNVEGMET